MEHKKLEYTTPIFLKKGTLLLHKQVPKDSKRDYKWFWMAEQGIDPDWDEYFPGDLETYITLEDIMLTPYELPFYIDQELNEIVTTPLRRTLSDRNKYYLTKHEPDIHLKNRLARKWEAVVTHEHQWYVPCDPLRDQLDIEEPSDTGETLWGVPYEIVLKNKYVEKTE